MTGFRGMWLVPPSAVDRSAPLIAQNPRRNPADGRRYLGTELSWTD